MDAATLDNTAAESNGLGTDPEIERQMAADEAEWAKVDSVDGQSADSGRNAKGQFTSSNDAERAGEEDAEGLPGDAEDPATANQSKAGKPAATEVTPKPAAGEQAGKGEGEAGAKPEAKPAEQAKPEATETGSAWAKENARKSRTWEGINQTKAELSAEKEQLRLEREQFIAQQQSASGKQTDADGYSAADYTRVGKTAAQKAEQFSQQAMEAEGRGDFTAADRLHAKAAEETQLAHVTQQRAAALAGASQPGAVWERLKADLPEALQFNGPINRELRGLLRSDPKLLGDPMGPYRAAVQVGRKVLQKTEAELATAKVEAGKVPGLQKQIEELSSQVRVLQQATSLTGGGGTISRGGEESKKFEDLSLEEMEAQLRQ